MEKTNRSCSADLFNNFFAGSVGGGGKGRGGGEGDEN